MTDERQKDIAGVQGIPRDHRSSNFHLYIEDGWTTKYV